MHASELRAQLEDLHLELLAAESAGLTAVERYMQDLEDEINRCKDALVGATVIEIARARAEVLARQGGPLAARQPMSYTASDAWANRRHVAGRRRTAGSAVASSPATKPA